MRVIAKLRLLRALAYAALTSMTLLSCIHQPSAPPPCPLMPSLKVHGIPGDVCGTTPSFDEFGDMAWQTFKTLVWPASGRGIPDTSREITDMEGPRVFETYKGDWETFQALRAKPLAWHKYPSHVPEWLCTNAAAMPPLEKGTLVLASLHKFGNIDQRDDAPDGVYQGVFHMLVAQNGSVVRYLTGFGEKAFNLIRKNELYKPVNIARSYLPPTVGMTKADDGTITIKSAWIVMDDKIPNPHEFYVKPAWVQRPATNPAERICDPVNVGLVGLHIAHKTESSPQWIWASFEHVKNVPYSGQGAGKPHTFYDGSGKAMDPDPPLEAHLPKKDPFIVPAPYNVERLKEIPKAVKEVNDRWQQMLRKNTNNESVWAYYQLVAIQWPAFRKQPDHTGSGVQIGDMYSAQPEPPCFFGDASLANSVLETFLQSHTQCWKEFTCMTCHNRARSYDFIWSVPLAHKGPDPSHTRREALSALREILNSKRRE